MADTSEITTQSKGGSQLPALTKLLRKEEWYYPPSGNYGPKRYYLCDYCEFKTLSSIYFKSHIEKIHNITGIKSSQSRGVTLKKVSRSKRCNSSAGLKRKVERHVRYRSPVNLQEVPEIHKEELVVSPVATAESDVFAEQESEFEEWKKSSTNQEQICNEVGPKVPIYFCSKCSYWNRWVTGFHDHMLGHHTSDASYRCSCCDYANRFRTKVNLHIRKAKKRKGKGHSDAKTIMTHPVPSHKYASYQRKIVVGKGLNYGWATVPSSQRKDVDDVTHDLDQDFESASPIETLGAEETELRKEILRVRSEPKELDELTVYLDHDLESAPPLESLEAEELELRKEIIRVRKAIFENLSNPPKKKKQCTANLENLRSRVDSVKMKVKSTEQEVESLSSLKSYTEKKMKEVLGAKMKAEYDLRSHQCEVLSLQLEDQHPNVAPADLEKNLADAEEKAKSAEKELERKVAELESFRKEYDSLVERSKQTEDELAGASQILQVLEGELKEMEESGMEDAGNNMTREQIKDCMKLEKRLLKITYLKSLAKMCLQEKIWLEAIQRYEEQEVKCNSRLYVDKVDEERPNKSTVV